MVDLLASWGMDTRESRVDIPTVLLEVVGLARKFTEPDISLLDNVKPIKFVPKVREVPGLRMKLHRQGMDHFSPL